MFGNLDLCILDDTVEVAVKKFILTNRLKQDSLNSKDCFINEIINLQMLEEAKKSKKKASCSYFVEYLGFILHSDINYEYFGSIITKWYDLGTLIEYQNKNELATSELVDLACQIAKGKF